MLQVQPAQDPSTGSRKVVLNEMQTLSDTGLRVACALEGLYEEAPFIAVNVGLDVQNLRQIERSDLHSHSSNKYCP